MATNLKRFKASELAAAIGLQLLRGRPSKATRAWLEADVQDSINAGYVKVSKGKLVQV